MTPAEEMRAASARIRNTSPHAVPAPWLPDADGYEVHDADGGVIAEVGALSNLELRATVSHIALWDPAMTELVAQAIDDEAARWERNNAFESIWGTTALLKLARAINDKSEARDAG